MTKTPTSRSSATTSAWHGSDRLVKDVGCPFPSVIDLDRPGLGIAVETSDGTTRSLLGLDLGSDVSLADHWVRGDDVTAVYESADARNLRTTAMWRLHPAAASTRAWELIASAQTSLLHSDSVLAVVSRIDATELVWGTWAGGRVAWHDVQPPQATCVLLRRSGATGENDTTVLIVPHPGDAARLTVRRDGGPMIVECWLFSTMLEKGVLLRSRVLAAIGRSAGDCDWASRLVAAFAASPPMLTT